MRQPQLPILLPLLATILLGCSHEHGMNRPSGSASHERDELGDKIRAVQQARDAAAEADAIHNLHQYESSHGLTYTVQTTRLADNVPIASASVGMTSVNATVTVYHGQQVVRTFSFVPKDNRNLALLGE